MEVNWVQIISRGNYGGAIYGNMAKKALRHNFSITEKEIKAIYFKNRYFKALEWLWQLISLKGNGGVWIRSSFVSIALTRFKKNRGIHIALMYHLDNSVFPVFLKPAAHLLEKLFYFKLKKYDAIITISEYWRQYFLDKGYKNVHKIYPGFVLKDFDITKKQEQDFKNKYNLLGKTIVYIGNCQKVKGVIEAYETLKDLNVLLVTSGHRAVDIPALHLNLDYKEYLCLLKVSSIVVVMSKFKEGWCMTAHEAMLCKTPVIGSGLGGMKELLNGGKQIICSDFGKLKETVQHLLNDSALMRTMGENGYAYAKEFNDGKFRQEWLNMVNKLI